MNKIMHQLMEDFSVTEEATEIPLNEEKTDIAYERFVKTDEDEEIFASALAECDAYGFLKGFKCALLLKKECGLI